MISQSAAVLFLILSILAVASSQLLAKARLAAHFTTEEGRTLQSALASCIADPLMWCVLALMAAGAAFWYLAMTRLPVSLMLPLGSSVTPLVAIGAHYLLGESLPLSKAAAITLVVTGVVWLAVQPD
jgi:drug/metabolite transporter (DMT)-like permease